MECKFAPDKPINTIGNEKNYQLYYPFGRHFSAIMPAERRKILEPSLKQAPQSVTADSAGGHYQIESHR